MYGMVDKQNRKEEPADRSGYDTRPQKREEKTEKEAYMIQPAEREKRGNR